MGVAVRWTHCAVRVGASSQHSYTVHVVNPTRHTKTRRCRCCGECCSMDLYRPNGKVSMDERERDYDTWSVGGTSSRYFPSKERGATLLQTISTAIDSIRESS